MSVVNRNPANIQTVDVKLHAKLKVLPNLGFVHAKTHNLVSISLAELGVSISNFPHVFIQSPNDKRFILAAMLGLRTGENVYFGEEFWESTHVPLAVQRHPFVIGYDDRLTDREEITTCVETDSPFVSQTEGLALYAEDGTETEFLRNRQQLLYTIFESEKLTNRFIQKLQELDLLTSLEIALEQPNGNVVKINNLFTLDEVKLKNLSAEQLKALQTEDYLPPCYLILASLYQLNQLIRRHNRQGRDQIVHFRLEFGNQSSGRDETAGK